MHFLKKKCLKAVLSPRDAPHLLICLGNQVGSFGAVLLWGSHSRTHSMAIRGSGVGSSVMIVREILVSLALKDFHFVLKLEEKTS